MKMNLSDYSTLNIVKELIKRGGVSVKEEVNRDGSSLITILVNLDRDYRLISGLVNGDF